MQRIKPVFCLLHMEVCIRENSWLAKLAAQKMKADKVAIVFGNTIHLHNTSRHEFLSDKEWVCHELRHVQQYQQHGRLGFLAKYLWEWVKKGYTNNKFEVDARLHETKPAMLEKVVFVKR